MLHPDDEQYFYELRIIGMNAAKEAGIKCDSIEPSRICSSLTNGLAYCWKNAITIKVRHREAKCWGGNWYKSRRSDKEIYETLAHELAHLLDYQTHGKTGHNPRFRKYLEQMRIVVAKAIEDRKFVLEERYWKCKMDAEECRTA